MYGFTYRCLSARQDRFDLGNVKEEPFQKTLNSQCNEQSHFPMFMV